MNQASLAGGVGCMILAAYYTVMGSNHNDGAPLMADHRLRDLSGQEKRALEINIYDEIPLLLAQTQRRRQQVHACIVD
ncbi:hypothetical protein D3C73_1499890 [compost metagenome]